MIRINLLPFRLARKKENIRRQISIFVLLVFLSGVILFWYTQVMNKKIEVVKEKTDQVNSQITKYKEKADRVIKIKKNLASLEAKLKVIRSLEQKRDEQLVLFDGMTELIIPGRMWLESFKTEKGKVTIKGIAYDNPTIADFMKSLENSPLFSKVDLKTAKIKKFKGGITLKSFELLCTKQQAAPEQNKPGVKGKK